jgi:hypothetical protein
MQIFFITLALIFLTFYAVDTKCEDSQDIVTLDSLDKIDAENILDQYNLNGTPLNPKQNCDCSTKCSNPTFQSPRSVEIKCVSTCICSLDSPKANIPTIIPAPAPSIVTVPPNIIPTIIPPVLIKTIEPSDTAPTASITRRPTKSKPEPKTRSPSKNAETEVPNKTAPTAAFTR